MHNWMRAEPIEDTISLDVQELYAYANSAGQQAAGLGVTTARARNEPLGDRTTAQPRRVV